MQLLQGCYASEWVQDAQIQGINETILYAKVTQFCWQYVLTSWKECHWTLHDNTEPFEHVSHVHHSANNFSWCCSTPSHPSHHQRLDCQVHLSMAICSIASRTQCSAMHICDHGKAVATQAKLVIAAVVPRHRGCQCCIDRRKSIWCKCHGTNSQWML